MTLQELTFRLLAAPLTPDHSSYRPPNWPPPPDWIVSFDAQGNPLSRWADPLWDFSYWAGHSLKLRFSVGGTKRFQRFGQANQHLLRMVATWMVWGPEGPSAWNSLVQRFNVVKRLFSHCESEGISAEHLMRFPGVLNTLAAVFSGKTDRRTLIVQLDVLYRARDDLGFVLLDERGIAHFATLGVEEGDTEQTAYIPPRIWIYQVLRVRECIDDYLLHEIQIKECYEFCLQAYANSFGSLEAAFLAESETRKNCIPFSKRDPNTETHAGYVGPFSDTAERFGILSLLTKWLGKRTTPTVSMLSSYFLLVQYCGLAYTINFTLQRANEANSLRSDCLIWDEDEILGRIPLIRGETTKTEQDSDARWPCSPSVEPAIIAMRSLASLRMRCVMANSAISCTEDDVSNPHLIHSSFEPWSAAPGEWRPYCIRPRAIGFKSLLQRYPHLFEKELLRITEEDLTLARKFTPNLNVKQYSVGEIWPLAWHQLRRTSAVNMFASGLLDDSSMQVILKHRTVAQPLYYGRNYTRLRFNKDVNNITTAAKYETMALEISNLLSDRYVSPGGLSKKNEIVVNLVSARDFKKLAQAGRKGEISFRETRLGGCAKTGACEYGGIESISRCAGGDGNKPCNEAIYDRQRKASIERQLKQVENKLKIIDPRSPRGVALRMEAQGLRNYLNVVT